MIRNHWIILSGLALLGGALSAVAGDGWVVITSDPPGATIFVDSAYRGVTPQHPGDALRIKVPEGVRDINGVLRIDGKPYTARQTVTARHSGETPVRLSLRPESTAPAAPPAPTVVHVDEPDPTLLIPIGELEIPGRNF